MRFWFQRNKPAVTGKRLSSALEAKLAADVAALPLTSVQLVLGVLDAPNALSAPVSAMLKQACTARGVEVIDVPLVQAFVSAYLLMYEQVLDFDAPEVLPHFSNLRALHCDAAVNAAGKFFATLAHDLREAGLTK